MKIKEGKEDVFENWRKNNQDPYGVEVFEYAERWATLMEKARDNRGVVFSMAEVADETSKKADTTGISEPQHNWAKSLLRVCWEHGSEL